MVELWKSMRSLATGTQTNNRTYGFVFKAEADLWITHLGIYAPYTAEYTILLWDDISGDLVRSATGVATANKWSYFELDELIEVKSGDEYTIAYNHPSNGGTNYYRHPKTSSATHFTEGFSYIGSRWGSDNNVRPTTNWGPVNEALGICGLLFTTENPTVKRYKTSGTYTSNLITIQTGRYRIRWLGDKPTNTGITIEYTTGAEQGEWIEVSNGDVVTSDTNLWFRVTLETIDTSVTPTLQDLWIEEPDAPQDKILITMDWWGKFNNALGKIKVQYDSTKGTLQGSGGPVKSFTEEFMPTGLVQKPNPGPVENFKITAATAVDFIKIEYNNRYAEENFKITAAATITLTFVGVVNP